MMDLPPSWMYSFPNAMNSQAQSSTPFTSTVSSFFRRPSKIVKAGSRNTSPRNAGRRRTTTTLPVTRTRSVLDKQRASVPQDSFTTRPGRPLSWHPNSYIDFNVPSQELVQTPYPDQYQSFNPYMTTTVNGLVTPISYPLTDEPQIQELITPLEGLSAQDGTQAYDNGFDNSQYWYQFEVPKQQYTMDAMFQQPNPVQPSWQWNVQEPVDVQTAPSSPDFLPIQGGPEVSPLTLNTQLLPADNDGEELVGMGLYDSPADVQSTSLLFGGAAPVAGPRKSLKLEDSFEPTTEDDDAEQDEDNEESNDEDAIQEPGQIIQSFPAYADAYNTQTSNLMGHSFYFENDPNLNLMSYPDQGYYVNNGNYGGTYSTYNWV